MKRMSRLSAIDQAAARGMGQQARRVRTQVRRWWQVVELAARILVLMLTPASYAAARARSVLLHLYTATAPLLPWFLVLSALISVVLIRIVVVTATTYGLSQYALEVLVRTLVLELIPLYAALFVTLRHALPGAEQLRSQLEQRHAAGRAAPGVAELASALLPRALAGVFAVVTLAALSSVVALVLSYLMVYGFSPWALPAYTRAVGGVFSPAVSLIFVLKTFFFSLAVAVMPLAGAAEPDDAGGFTRLSDMTGFARLFSVLLVIEVLSLLGNYY